ncbi:transporter substrate-binding domain-containing protein [Desulfovibrio sp. JC010]|uniref:substrate-binding periplasmic protein n=1 Tax=Desulfovibrio sp. JC010 TaxID=2593641 RepID=UPI0013D52008
MIVPTDHYPPWRLAENDTDISGIHIELTDHLLKQLGLKAEYVLRPWSRCLLMLERGTADIMAGLLKTKERSEYLIYLDPPYSNKDIKAFYVRHGNSGTIKSYSDLVGMKIGTTLGNSYFPKFDNDTQLQKDPAQNEETCFKKLLYNRIDTVIISEDTGDYLVNKHGYQGRIEKAEYKYSLPLSVYFAVSKKSPLADRIPELEAAMKKMVESGEVRKMVNNFLKKQN